jgi:hypothetical protein
MVHVPLVPTSWIHGHVARLPWELNHIRLNFTIDRWAWPPVAAWVLLGIQGSEPPVTLGMTCTIVGLVYKLPPHFSVV